MLLSELCRASLGNEQVELGEASFPRDTLVSVSGLKPLRLDVVLFFAKHTAPLNWSVDRVNYVKVRLPVPLAPCLRLTARVCQEAREAGVAPVDFTDRAKLLDFLKGEAHERQAKRPRVSDAAGPSGLVLSDGLLDGPTDTPFSSCRQLHDRNSVLLAKSKASHGLRLGYFCRCLTRVACAELRARAGAAAGGDEGPAGEAQREQASRSPAQVKQARPHAPNGARIRLRRPADTRRSRSRSSGKRGWARAMWTSWASTQTPPSSLTRCSPCRPPCRRTRHRRRQRLPYPSLQPSRPGRRLPVRLGPRRKRAVFRSSSCPAAWARKCL